MKDWIYDLVEEALYYEVYDNPDYQRGEYDWVTERKLVEATEDCAEFLRDSGELPLSNPDWRDEESAHMMVLDWMGSYFG